MKKNTCIAAIFMALAFGMMSCKQAVESKIVNGTVLDASMNNIVLTTSDGSSIDISTMDTNPEKVPGVLIDDSVKVTCIEKDVDGVKVLTATELVILRHSPYYYIQGTWTEPNPINAKEVQGFTLNQDGTAQSINMATLDFSEWNIEGMCLHLNYKSIGNGITIEGVDTLNIEKIDADSLVLSENGMIAWRLGREKSA